MENIFITINKDEINNESYMNISDIPNDYIERNIEIHKMKIDKNTYNLILNSLDNIFISFFCSKDTINNDFSFLHFLTDDLYRSQIISIKKIFRDDNKKYTIHNDGISKKIYVLNTFVGNNFSIYSTSKENLLFLYRNYRNEIDSDFFYNKSPPFWYKQMMKENVPDIKERYISSEIYDNCLVLEQYGLIYAIK